MKTKYAMPKTYYGPPYWAPPANWFERLDRALKRLVVWSDRRDISIEFFVCELTGVVAAVLIGFDVPDAAICVLLWGLIWLFVLCLALRIDVEEARRGRT